MARIVRGALIQATLCEPATSPVAKIKQAMIDKHVGMIAQAADKGDYSPLLLTLNQDNPSTSVIWLWEPYLDRTVRGLMTEERTEEAAALARGFCRFMPRSSTAWFDLALAAWELERYEEGFKAFRNAEALARPTPTWGMRFMTAALIATHIEELDLQTEYYEKAMRAGHLTPLLLNNLAWSYYLKNEKTKIAIQPAEQAVKLNPNDVPALDTLARLLARDTQRERALQIIDHAIELSLFDSYVEDMRAFRRRIQSGSLE